MRELSAEDSLRLNVLLANRPLAIRIDESRMAVHALSHEGEMRIELNPNCRDEQYLRRVRELLSGHVLGSPGGYPVYLQRWTRMGQMRDESLEELLLLGEPEAVVAAVCAPGLTDELARRAWWAMEDAGNARRMLANPSIVEGEMGPVLAAYLYEHLPFETEVETMVETVRLILQPGLLDEAARNELWKRAARKNAYYVGFLLTIPDRIPLDTPAHPRAGEWQPALRDLADAGNPLAAGLLKLIAPAGQACLQCIERALKKPATQDAVTLTLDAVRDHYAVFRPEGNPDLTWDELLVEARDFVARDAGPATALRDIEGIDELLRGARLLSGVGYGVLRPLLRDTTAIGSLMRRKIAPFVEPFLEEVGRLRGGYARRP